MNIFLALKDSFNFVADWIIHNITPDASAAESVRQTILLDNMHAAQKWIDAYELHRGDVDISKQKQIMPASPTFAACFGLSSILADAVLNSPTPEARLVNINGFFDELREMAHIPILPMPDDNMTQKEELEAKMFFNKVNPFILKVMQMQSNCTTRVDPIPQKISDVLEEASIKPTYKVTYYLDSKDQLLDWAKQAKNGEALHLSTPNHSILIYAYQDQENRNIVGFYDSDYEFQRLEILQNELSRSSIRTFAPLHPVYHPNSQPLLACEHLSNSPIDKCIFTRATVATSASILIAASSIDDVDTVKEILDTNPQLASEARHSTGMSFLRATICDMSHQTLKYLVENFPALLDNEETNPLLLCMQSGSTDRAAFKIIAAQKPYLLHKPIVHGNSLLSLTILHQDSEFIEIIGEAAPDILTLNMPSGRTPGQFAITLRHYDILREMIKINPAIMTTPDESGSTMVHNAIYLKNFLLLKLLVEADKACITATDQQGQTAFELALLLSSNQENTDIFLPMLEFMIEHNKSILASCSGGRGHVFNLLSYQVCNQHNSALAKMVMKYAPELITEWIQSKGEPLVDFIQSLDSQDTHALGITYSIEHTLFE